MPSKQSKPFSPKNFGPHIRDQISVPQIMWTVVLALLPAVIAHLVLKRYDAFRIVTISLASAILSEMGMRRLFAKRVSVYDGSVVITALLYALLIPPDLPSWMAALGAIFAVIVGKEIFGGLGQNPFNPALVGIIFLSACFPAARKLFLIPIETGPLKIYSAAVFLGGIILVAKRIIDWSSAFFYLAGFLVLRMICGTRADFSFLSIPLLAAFFLVTDPVTTPLMQKGRRLFALTAGAMTGFLQWGTSAAEAVVYSILLMNGLVPWFDHFLRPIKRKS